MAGSSISKTGISSTTVKHPSMEARLMWVMFIADTPNSQPTHLSRDRHQGEGDLVTL